MSRLFDAGAEAREREDARRRRDEAKSGAERAAEALKEYEELDEASRQLGEQLAQAQAVTPIHYSKYRRPGSRWVIEHARDGDDYIYQLFPLKPPRGEWPDVITMLIGAMDVVFPRSIQVVYKPPNEEFKLNFYTIRVKNIVGVPDWEPAAKERALRGLAAVDVW